MSDIFQEVEEDVRREHYEKLWNKYGNYLIALATVFVLAAGAYQFWTSYDLRQRESFSDRFLAASQTERTGDFIKAESEFLALAKDAPAGYATLAKFHLSALNLAQGKRDQAIVLLRELIGGGDPLISSSARLRLAWMQADAMSRADLAKELDPLTAADNPWRFAATEILAYKDIREGARAQALASYQKLSQEPDASPSLKQRAAALADYLKANMDSGATGAAPASPSLAPASQEVKPK